MTEPRAHKPPACRLAALLVLAMAGGCQPPSHSTYFPQDSSAAQSISAASGLKVYAGIANLDIAPGDVVLFQSIETSTPGVRGLVGRLRETNAAIGMARESDLTDSDLAPYHDLGGTFSAGDGAIGILIEFTMPTGQVDITTPVLVFSVNGGPAQREPMLMNLRACPASIDECPGPEPPALRD